MRCLLYLILVTAAASVSELSFSIDTTHVHFEVSERFMAFTMDASSTSQWSTFEHEVWRDPLTRALAAHLSPAYFRFGGTEGDYTLYDFGSERRAGEDTAAAPPTPYRQVLNATVFDAIAEFARASSWDFIFGANVLLDRSKSSDTWEDSHLKTLLAHASSANMSFAGFELGNEPDLMCKGTHGERFSCHHAPPNVSEAGQAISPEQEAADFEAFSSLVKSYYPTAKIIGNDVANAVTEFSKPFLQALKTPLDVYTYHFYYGPGSSQPHGLDPSNFSTPAVLDRFLTRALEAQNVSRAVAPASELWCGETSSTYGGGSVNASASFVAGFMWLDKLGVAANLGHRVVVRQTFAHSSYSVIGAQSRHGKWDSLPNPDYWSSILWRRLVGSKVLRVQGGLELGRAVRAYAFCAANTSGGVAVVVLNTNTFEVDVQLDLPSGSRSVADVYMLTSYPDLATSRDVFLNGELLRLADASTGELPPQKPWQVAAGEAIVMPARSYGFIVLPGAAVGVCGGDVILI